MFSLNKKIVLITGAGSGIGAAMAESFAQAGAHVFVTDINETGGPEVVAKIKSARCPAEFIRLDVTNEADCSQVARQVLDSQGRLDVLVNNAGIGSVGTLLQTTGQDMDRLYAVNVRGIFNLTKAFLPDML